MNDARPRRIWALAAAMLAALLLFPRAARADADEDRLKARELADQGKAALSRRDYAAAADLFERASSLVSAPTLELGRARAAVGLGHWLEARAIYARLVATQPEGTAPQAFVKAISEATEELAKLDRRMPAMVLAVQGGEAEVTLDGAPVPKAEVGARRLVDPGLHVARATAPGFRPAEVVFTASEGAVSQVQLDLAVELLGQRQRRTVLGFSLIGLGTSALAFSAATGALALGDVSSLSSRCKLLCAAEDNEKIDSYYRFTFLAVPALTVGALGVGGGLALFLTSNREGALLPAKIGPALLGAGLGGIALGAVTGFLTLRENAPCAGPVCQEDHAASYGALRVLSYTSLGVGFAAAIPGTLLVVLRKNAPASPRATGARRAPGKAPALLDLTPQIGPGAIGLSGRF